jgi:uncharacterized membrane protein YbhN (UPF0104 family)
VVPVDVEQFGIGAVLHRFGPVVLRVAGGIVVLVLLGCQVGEAPFQAGLRAVTWPAIVSALVITAITTVCAAWRWRLVARGLGVGLTLPSAVGAYYRSQFVNSVLPGGVLGDVHRAVVHGRGAGAVGRGARAVAWERFCGQVIQALLTAAVLIALPSPVRPAVPYLSIGVAVLGSCVALAVWVAARRGKSRPARVARTVVDDLRTVLLARHVWPQLTLTSVLVVAGHTATFVIAARVAGSTAPLGELIALLLLVQTAMVIPLSIGGWGVREGAAAWAFAAAGLGAATGITVTTLYAVIAFAAITPGATLLLHDAIRGGRRRSAPSSYPSLAGYRAERVDS